MSRQATSPTVSRVILGQRLRLIRETAGVTREQAATVVGGSESKISRLERGRVGCQDRDLAELAECYGLADPHEREKLFGLARASRKRRPGGGLLPEWLATHVDLEEAASVIRTYELQFIPGLLQTAGYARAVIAAGHPGANVAEIDRRVALRMDRTQLLLHPDPPRLWAVIDEAALRRGFGGRIVMRAQLEHLLEASKLPRISVQVLPAAAGGHAAEGGAFSLLRFPQPELADVVYIEHLTRGFHLDDPDEVETYTQAADNLAVQAATPGASTEIIAGIRDEL